MQYAVRVNVGREETEIVSFQTLEEALEFKNMVMRAKDIYYAHTQKKGYNTVIVLDSPVYRDGHRI